MAVRLQPKTIRITAMARKIPTPTETVRMRTMFSRPFTCSARITKSGSEIVTRIPIMKLTKAMSQIFLLAPTVEPIFEPRGCIDISAPMVKRLMPNTRQTIPTRKRNMSPVDIGTIVILSPKTIRAIGKTDFSDSASLSLKRFKSYLLPNTQFFL